MDDLLRDYPVVIEFPVAWGEMDAFGHVNNVQYFRYFENARIAYAGRIRLHEHKDETGIGPILAQTSCRYRHPLVFPDTLRVGARVVKMEDDRFTMQYLVVSMRHGRVAAEGDGVIVMYDYRENRKATVPAVIRERVLALEPGLRAE